MEANSFVNVADFMQHLKDNNLVIVKQDELEKNAELKRAQLLRKKDLSLSEIVAAKFFKVIDTETLRRWCLNGKFTENGYYQLKNGQFRILSTAIKMVLYGN